VTPDPPGLPRGTAALALALAERAAAAASALTGVNHRVDHDAVLAQLLLPLVVGDDPNPVAPRAAPAGGHVHADVLPDDEPLLELLHAEPPAPDSERLASRAQECRLPVTPYRAAVASWPAAPDPPPPSPGRRVEPGAVRVVDLSAMWAGPLCTRLLADWGADVLTVEPDVRRDGLRLSPAQFAVLDQGKRRVPWDLRVAADRAAFEAAVAAADVLVESYSRRVLPNLGYPPERLHALNPRLVVVQLRAFPADTPESHWVAYGRGVHAASGLGVVDGVPAPALLAYPDPLAGLEAFGTILGALGANRGTVVEVSLASALASLLPSAGAPLVPPDPALVMGTGSLRRKALTKAIVT
jgi:CoA-transferase family III